ncbi:signal peptidase I [Microbacterium sp. SS28]|uniref:signal peptidase I n=1 Tax=Microbacterium sp. SS28 TaxID=2919948 RepID=UPI001FA96093|nr:signal peptidase I [Microbacterium sp. SS28]
MTAQPSRGEPPGWHGRPLEDLPWAVVIRVAVCWAVVCMILTLLAAAFLPRPFGFIGTTVVTGSMMPNIQPGDVALVQNLPEYGLGQVILFPNPARPEQRIMHRIVEIRDDGMLVTKGDANEMRDSTPVDPETVIGVGRILVPVIGLPIVWAANGYFLLVLLTVALTALVVRGTLRIELFPWVSKRAFVRAIIESTVVIAMLAVAVFVIFVGVARSAHAAFIERSVTEASWAMAGSTPTPTPTSEPSGTCSITDWIPEHWPNNQVVHFKVVNNTGSPIVPDPDGWVLVWTWTSDEQITVSGGAEFLNQVDRVVTYQAYTWSRIEPGEGEAAWLQITSASDTFLPPKDFLLNGAPCDFIPAAGDPVREVPAPPSSQP